MPIDSVPSEQTALTGKSNEFTDHQMKLLIGKYKYVFYLIQNVNVTNINKYAQSWTALFRAFSSHRQPSAIFFKGIPS